MVRGLAEPRGAALSDWGATRATCCLLAAGLRSSVVGCYLRGAVTLETAAGVEAF